jgi:outer membrane receptor protein involved in Fe transport
MEAGPERKLSDQRLQLLGNFPLKTGRRLETRVQAQRHNIIEMEDDPEALARGEFVEVPVFDLTLSTLLGEALLHHSVTSRVSGTAGFTGKLQHNRTGGVVPLIPGSDQQGAGAFLMERATAGPFTFLGGARAEVALVRPDGHPKRAFNTATWSLGGVARLAEGVSLSANVGTAWRAPTLFELYAMGPRLGEARYEIGRDDLDPERSVNVDVGLRWALPRFRAQVSAYQNDFTDFLFIQPTEEVEDGYQVYRYDQADAVLRGGEVSVDAEATPWLSLSAKGDYVRGTNEARSEPLPLMPPRRFTLGGEVHEAWPNPDSWAYAGVELEAVAKPDRLNPLDLAVDGYTLLHLTAGVRGTLRGRDAGVDLRVRNAANVEYRDFLSRYKAFALNPGRDIVLRLRMAF